MKVPCSTQPAAYSDTWVFTARLGAKKNNTNVAAKRNEVSLFSKSWLSAKKDIKFSKK